MKRVKARKNMVPDVVDLATLADEAVATDKQINVAFVKPELGKLRMAVSGDMLTYLKMAWVNRMLGGAYMAWPGNTSEEDFEQQTLRMLKMLQLCARGFGLPYDYEGFDHQPTRKEIVTIVVRILYDARRNVPDDPRARSEFDSIASSIVMGFFNAKLEVHVDESTRVFDVTGGLMSGLRLTTLIGNAWNTVMTGLMLKVLEGWGRDRDWETHHN